MRSLTSISRPAPLRLVGRQSRAASKASHTLRSLRDQQPELLSATRPFSSNSSPGPAQAQEDRRPIQPTHDLTHAAEADSERTLSRWISDLTGRPSRVSYDTIDIERASQLRRILPTRQDRPDLYAQDADEGEILPCAHHLVYFRPKPMLRDLGQDGSSTEYNAPPPYNRRMWAGEKMMWPDDVARRLRVGDEVTQVVRVPRVEFKKDMIFVQQEISIYSGRRTRDALGEDDWSVRELRTHVFRRPESRASIAAKPSPPSPSTSSQSQSSDNANAIADVSAKTSIKPDVEVEANDNASAVSSQGASRNTTSSVGEEEIQAPKSLSIERGQDDAYHPLRSSPSDSVISSESQAPIPSISLASTSSSSSVFFTYRPDSPLLFLYSALTHNPHKVHYDHPWTVHKEGHLAPLVHGPLTATLLVELACAAGESQGKTITEFEYRATSPMVIDKDIHMSGDWTRDDTGPSSTVTLTLSAEQGGKVGMKAVAKYK